LRFIVPSRRPIICITITGGRTNSARGHDGNSAERFTTASLPAAATASTTSDIPSPGANGLVYEKQAWEYKIIAKDAGTEELLTEQDLNALGSSGWELTAVATVAGEVQFYFKRARE
jgi:hypothetical protein